MHTLKQRLKTISERVGIRHRLKASFVYDAYWTIVDRQLIEAKRKELSFYRSLLEGFHPRDLVFDIGANHGTKTEIYLKLGARVVAAEPDQLNQDILREKFLKFRLSPKPVVIVGKAVSDRNATETMWVDGPGSALNTLSSKWVVTLREDKTRFQHTHNNLDFGVRKLVETTTLEQMIVEHGLPFFIKIDVEGHEASVLRGLNRPVPFLSFEVNLPEFRPEGLECLRLLEVLAPEGKFNFASDCKNGLVMKEWLNAAQFAAVLKQCPEKSIDVFWKTNQPNRR